MALLAITLGVATKSSDHAGVQETSDVYYVAEELVDLSRLVFPIQPIQRYPVPPETLCPDEDRPWNWKNDWRPKVSKAIGEANTNNVIAYCRNWLATQGIRKA